MNLLPRLRRRGSSLLAAFAVLRFALLRSFIRRRPIPAMNRCLLDKLDDRMRSQMRVCDKNVANESGDAAAEQRLKNVFLIFQQRLRELHDSPALAQTRWDDLISQLKRIAGDVVDSMGYRPGDWAKNLLHDTIEYQRQLVEAMPPGELAIETPNTTRFNTVCPACAEPLLVERDDDGFTVERAAASTGLYCWSSIASGDALDISGSCPACGQWVSVCLRNARQN